MIHFNYTQPNDIDYEGHIQVVVGEVDSSLLPLRVLHKSLSGEVLWSADLHSGYWSAYSMLTYTSMEIFTATGQLLAKWKWNPFLHGDYAHQQFELWAMKHVGANGIAIGTHNGMTGEWVGPLDRGTIRGTLVEASQMQYAELCKFYGKKSWIKCRKDLVTPHGGEVEFHEGGEGWTNSVSVDSISKYVGEFTTTKRSSISINDLLREVAVEGKIEWIHLDVEGLDEKLIRSILPEYMPSVLIYEHENTDEESNGMLETYLQNQGYTVTKSGRNVFCHKN